jgi:hypothetical protein
LEPVLFSRTGFNYLFKIRPGFKPNIIKPVLTGQPVINKTAKPVLIGQPVLILWGIYQMKAKVI